MNSRQYQQAINSWAKANFTYMDKIGLGMVEEIGEYCHALLKSKQQIRRHALKGGPKTKGVDFKAALERKRILEPLLKDALGDGMIFTLHWAETNETFISFEETTQYCLNNDDCNEYNAISILLQSLSVMFRTIGNAPEWDTPRPSAQRIFNGFALIAKVRGWNWKEILSATWKEVSNRDWNAFPTNGTTK